jgi:hypothetical protein
MTKKSYLQAFAWSLSALVAVLAITAWGQELHWKFAHLSVYSFFPVLGLLAFSLMWCHYTVSAARQYLAVDKKALHTYIEVTGWIVLALIIFHPGLLEWQLFKDGFGLPPGSVLDNYVTPSLKLFAVFGMVALLLFLAYELRRWYEDRSWWKYVSYATDAAMILIIFHSLKLGTTLQHGWLRMVWLFYALTFVIALTYIYVKKFSKPAVKHP